MHKLNRSFSICRTPSHFRHQAHWTPTGGTWANAAKPEYLKTAEYTSKASQGSHICDYSHNSARIRLLWL